MRRRGHRERERRLEVGLLEAGEDPPGVGYFELGVEVDLAVDRVDETVQALAGVHVGGLGDHLDLVLRLQALERYSGTVVHRQRVERCAVQDDLAHGGRDEVQPGLLGVVEGSETAPS